MITWLKKEAVLLAWAGVLLLFSLILVAINLLITHYQGIGYELHSLLRYLPWGVGIILIGIYLRRFSDRLSTVFDTIGKLYWVFLLSAFGCYAIQFTPFHLINTSLLHFDRALGFSSTAIYTFTMNHAWLKAIANVAYKSLSYQLFAIPLLLALLLEKRSVTIFFIANLIAALIGFSIYYFLPSNVPAQVLPNVVFNNSQYQVIAQWYEIHLHLKNYIHVGDLIDFPSFHVIWAVLLTYACRHRKWLCYPIAVLNILLIFATMQLGWHFLTDVLAGLAVGTVAIYMAEKSLIASGKLSQRFNRQSLHDNGKNYDAISHR